MMCSNNIVDRCVVGGKEGKSGTDESGSKWSRGSLCYRCITVTSDDILEDVGPGQCRCVEMILERLH